MDAATIQLLRETLREAFAATERAAVTSALHDLGWDDVVAEDEARATSLLFEEQGRALATSDMLDAVLIRATGLPAVTPGGVTPGTARPHRVLYPTPYDSTPVAPAPHSPATVGTRSAPGRDEPFVSGLATGPVPPGTRLVAVLANGAEPALAVVETSTLTTVEAVAGLDPDTGWSQVSG